MKSCCFSSYGESNHTNKLNFNWPRLDNLSFLHLLKLSAHFDLV